MTKFSLHIDKTLVDTVRNINSLDRQYFGMQSWFPWPQGRESVWIYLGEYRCGCVPVKVNGRILLVFACLVRECEERRADQRPSHLHTSAIAVVCGRHSWMMVCPAASARKKIDNSRGQPAEFTHKSTDQRTGTRCAPAYAIKERT